MSPEEDRRLYLQHKFTALRHYCLAVTGKAHAFVYPAFFEKYDVLKPHVFDKEGFKLVRLNLADDAVRDLEFCEDGIFFRARFNGASHEFYLPFDQIMGLTNCRDEVIHRLAIAPTAMIRNGVDYMVMMDYSMGQNTANYADPTPPEPPKPERPSFLKVVK